MPNRVDLNIAGYTLTVRSDRPAERLERLGEMVNEKVREIQRGGSTANYLNVILLASITLAEEILVLKERIESREAQDEAAERNILAALQKALGQ
jgi:cell division protein ZapA (FtsZ GTPase activity inhibitor)